MLFRICILRPPRKKWEIRLLPFVTAYAIQPINANATGKGLNPFWQIYKKGSETENGSYELL